MNLHPMYMHILVFVPKKICRYTVDKQVNIGQFKKSR